MIDTNQMLGRHTKRVTREEEKKVSHIQLCGTRLYLMLKIITAGEYIRDLVLTENYESTCYEIRANSTTANIDE